MPKTRIDVAERAAADIHRAKRLLATARGRLARATYGDAPSALVEPKLRAVQSAIDERGAYLQKIPGVLGYGIGQVMQRGMPTGQLCVTVFVEKKLTPAELRKTKTRAIPRSIAVGKRRVRVDVVTLGKIRRQVLAGASIGTSAPSKKTAGTVGAFAIDNDTKDVVAITAMHVSGISQFPNGKPPIQFVVPSRFKSSSPQPFGALALGTMSGVDAAKIILADASDASNVIPGIGTIAGWRPVTIPGDNNASVRMFGASTAKVVSGRIIHPSVALPAFGLSSAILADIQSKDGDSGAALVDSANLVLGFLVGQGTDLDPNFERLRIFTPAADVFDVLRCDIH